MRMVVPYVHGHAHGCIMHHAWWYDGCQIHCHVYTVAQSALVAGATTSCPANPEVEPLQNVLCALDRREGRWTSLFRWLIASATNRKQRQLSSCLSLDSVLDSKTRIGLIVCIFNFCRTIHSNNTGAEAASFESRSNSNIDSWDKLTGTQTFIDRSLDLFSHRFG